MRPIGCRSRAGDRRRRSPWVNSRATGITTATRLPGSPGTNAIKMLFSSPFGAPAIEPHRIAQKLTAERAYTMKMGAAAEHHSRLLHHTGVDKRDQHRKRHLLASSHHLFDVFSISVGVHFFRCRTVRGRSAANRTNARMCTVSSCDTALVTRSAGSIASSFRNAFAAAITSNLAFGFEACPSASSSTWSHSDELAAELDR
jgi:hypothetical protein